MCLGRALLLLFFCMGSLLCLNGQEIFSDTLPESLPKPVRIIGDANIICHSASVSLKVDYSAYGTIVNPMIVWSTGETTEKILVSPNKDTTLYTVSLFDGDIFIAKDTFKIYVTNLPPYQVVNDTICLGAEAKVGVIGGRYWLWSTLGTTSYINDRPLRNTRYGVKISNYPIHEIGYINACYLEDTATAVVNNQVSFILVGDSVVCGENIASVKVVGGSNIVWNDGSTAAEIGFTPVQDTILRVVASDRYDCRGEKTWKVQVRKLPTASIETSVDTLCLGEEMQLTIVSSMADVIKWYTGETTKTITIKPKISLIAYCDIAMSSDKGKCSGRIFKAVEVKNCSKMFFPSGFKLDGYTKVYGPIGKIDTNRKYYFAIFSRSGKRIFETQDLKVGWDGKYKGQWVPAGVYVYYFKEIYDRFVWDRNGNITVIK